MGVREASQKARQRTIRVILTVEHQHFTRFMADLEDLGSDRLAVHVTTESKTDSNDRRRRGLEPKRAPTRLRANHQV